MSTKNQRKQMQEVEQARDSMIDETVNYHLERCVINAKEKGITLNEIYNAPVINLNGKTLANKRYSKDELEEKLENSVDFGRFRKVGDRYFDE